MDEIIKGYIENGIGLNCNTDELKQLKIIMNQTKQINFYNLTYLEGERTKFINNLLEADQIEKSLINEELEKIKKEINLIVISLRFNNIDEFLKDKLS